MLYCENCGNKVLETTKFCSNCGKAMIPVLNPHFNPAHSDVKAKNSDISSEGPKKDGFKVSSDYTHNEDNRVNDVIDSYKNEKQSVTNFDLISKKFPYHRYIVGLFVLLIPGIVLHWYYMDGPGKDNLGYLIDLWGGIGKIPIQKALLYDFHYTWATYTFPQIIVVGIFWIFKYNEFNYKKSIGKDQHNASSPLMNKDGAGIR